jgi:peptidoglycan hydrolase-like protein with peptidoglycan-binding domain
MTVQESTKWGTHLAKSGDAAEHPPNSNHTIVWDLYHDITGAPAYQGQPWCGAGLICVLHHGGWTPPANWIGVYAIQAWGEAHKRWVRGSDDGKAGDTLVIGGPGVHTEYARSDVRADGSMLTCGCNTSPGSEGSQFNGGTCALKVRTAAEIYGHVITHDLLGGAQPPKPHPVDTKPEQPQYRRETPRGTLHLWEQGPRVEHLQHLLGIPVDGYFGHDTAVAINGFKAHHPGFGSDGAVAGPKFVALLERHGQAKVAFKTLRRGDKGGAVRKLQHRLIAHGLLPAKVDGIRQDDGDFGSRTERAVKKVEQAHGWRVNGTAGDRVWRALA